MCCHSSCLQRRIVREKQVVVPKDRAGNGRGGDLGSVGGGGGCGNHDYNPSSSQRSRYETTGVVGDDRKRGPDTMNE